MSPPEFFVVLALIITAGFLGWYLMSGIFSYIGGGKGDQGEVKLSELQALVEIAVERANRPLLDRIDRLEEKLERPESLPPRKRPLLDEDEEFLAAEKEKTSERERVQG